MRRTIFAALALTLIVVTGCATYASRVRGARLDFELGRYDAAIETLKGLAERKDVDELLYLLDLGVVYHTAGRYQDAIDTFTKADELAVLTDYTSVSQEVGSVIVNDTLKTYRGEDFEKVLISVYLAMDYLLLGKYEDALVATRRVNRKLDVMINEGKLPYNHNIFAKYLAAAIFESQGEYNDAFVDYRQLRKTNAETPYLGVGLLRMADKLKSSQEFDEYRKQYPDVKDYRLGKDKGEVVLLLEQGKVPYKVPHPNFYLIPMFLRNSYYSDSVWMRAADGGPKVHSEPLYDIEATAIKELDNRAAGIIAKKVGGVVVKEAVGYAVGEATGDKTLGALTAIMLRVTDQADLRSWTTLPARLQIARLTLPAGRHDIVLDMVSRRGDQPGIKRFTGVEVKAGKTVFLNYRTPD